MHRRPRVPARRRARAVRADQGHHHRRWPQRVPRGHRALDRRARRCARRQRHRLRRRGLQGQGERGRRRRGAPARRAHARRRAQRGPPPNARGVRAPAARRDAGAPRHVAEDVIGQAATLEVPRALPRRRARAHRVARCSRSEHRYAG